MQLKQSSVGLQFKNNAFVWSLTAFYLVVAEVRVSSCCRISVDVFLRGQLGSAL